MIRRVNFKLFAWFSIFGVEIIQEIQPIKKSHLRHEKEHLASFSALLAVYNFTADVETKNSTHP